MADEATGPVHEAAPLPPAQERAAGLTQVGVEVPAQQQEEMVFALAAAKRQRGDSFLADFAAALLTHAPNSEAQLFQDVFAAFVAGFRPDGYFVEVGTGDGKLISNTYFLEKRLGWAGMVVEPNPVFLPALRRNRACRIATDCVYDVTGRTVRFMCTADPEFSRIDDANSDQHDDRRAAEFTEVELTSVSLADLLDRYDCPDVIDYLSLDVEGPEFEILQSFDFASHRINAITVEHNYTESREAIRNLLEDNGYIRVFEHLSQWDDWYVRRDVLAAMPAAAAVIAAAQEPVPPPLDAGTFVQWAIEAADRGAFHVAEALCRQAIAIDPADGGAWRTLATAAAQQGLRSLAIDRWREAVAHDPADYWARIGLAEMLAARGIIAEAVEHLRAAQALPGDVGRAGDLLARLAPKLSSVRPSA